MPEPLTMPDVAGDPGTARQPEQSDVLDQDVEVTGFGTVHTRTVETGTVGTGFADAQPTVPPTKREREAGWMRSALGLQDLTQVPIEELRVVANRMFRLLDTDRPPLDAEERYIAVVAEIEARMRQLPAPSPVQKYRPVFKDSAFGSRFELFLDGSLAAYIRYALVGSQLTLRVFVESSGFEGRGLAPVLMRYAMLHAHKRRLGVIPGCTAAQAFLEQNPQYRTLARMAY
jgi:predicted GNAT family acetyltransferase